MAEILLVEDDYALRVAMAEILRLAGYSVRAAVDAEAGLKALAEQVPDLLVVDVLMPGMSGIELATAMREYPKWKAVPIVFASASTTLENEGEIEAIENSFFLRKPFDAEELEETVAKVLAGD